MENLHPIFKDILDNQLSINNNNNLLPCPFCGGVVVEEIPSWNIANAKCEKCGEQWVFVEADIKTGLLNGILEQFNFIK